MNLLNYYSTGQLAEILGLSRATIVLWDKKGTLKPVYRSENGFRYYSKEQLYEIQRNRGERIQELPEDVSDNVYLRCWECGTLLPSCISTTINRIMCAECRPEYEKTKEETLNKYIHLKMKVMYERALRLLEKSEKVNMVEIEEAAKAIGDYCLKNLNAFASSQEMVAAIVLIQNRIKIKLQYPVKSKRIDIYIPELNCGLEVDGVLHKGKELKDSKRDVLLRDEMGADFEVIRIPTKYIEQNPLRIVDYIKEAYKQKKQLREKNSGILPEYYSKREGALYKTLMK